MAQKKATAPVTAADASKARQAADSKRTLASVMAERLSFTGETWDNDARNWADVDVLTMSRKMVLSSVLYRLHSQIEDPRWGFAARHDKAQSALRAELPRYQNNEISAGRMRSLTNQAFNAEGALAALEKMRADFLSVYEEEFGAWEAPEMKAPEPTDDNSDERDMQAKLAAMGINISAANIQPKTDGVDKDGTDG